MTRVLIISDTHRAPLQQNDTQPAPTPPFIADLPQADLLIHCGDLTMMGGIEEYHDTLDMLKLIKAPVKLVIAGNHDLTLDRDFMLSHVKHKAGGSHQLAEMTILQERDLWTSPEQRAVQEGVTFLDEGHHQIDLPNGATVSVYASPYTPEFCDWGFPYEHNEDRFNPKEGSLSDAKSIARHPVGAEQVDIMITHGPPYQVLDWTYSGERVGCPHLLRASMTVKPLIHCFGHIHEGWGAERVTWSDTVEDAIKTSHTISDWKNGAWKSGIQKTERYDLDLTTAQRDHAVLISSDTKGPIIRGSHTLMVNAAIMDVEYKPLNAPVLVEIGLPKKNR